MKKTFKIQDLDCANCAAKIERKISKIQGVNNVSVNFMTQKLVLDANDDVFDTVFKSALKIVSEVEPDCKVIVK